jgi:transposase
MTSRSIPYRFYNSSLRDNYNACILPVKDPFHAANAVQTIAYSKKTLQRSAWKETIHTPPFGMEWPHGSCGFLSSPFQGFIPGVSPSSQRNIRRRLTLLSSSSQEGQERLLDEGKKRKMTNGQKRKANLDGHFRAYKIRMLPTPAQRKELDRCFSVARAAYNWANECVREGFEQPNHYALRNKFRANNVMGSLSFANTSATRVSSNIASQAIKQLTDAYASNFAKQKKNPTHKFKVRFRSFQHTLTETIIIDKDIAGPDNLYTKKTSTLLRFLPLPSTCSRQGRVECLAYFGNNLKHIGGIRLQDSVKAITKIVGDGDRLKEDAKIIWDKRTQSYHFVYLYVIPSLDDPDPEFESKRIASTDPGCSPFQQWYSPTSGCFGQLLEEARPVLRAKCLKLDALQARIARRYSQPQACLTSCRENQNDALRQRELRYHTTRRLRRKLARDRRRLHGWIESAHYDAANFMLTDHEIIIQPVLSIQRLTAKTSRIFSEKMARAMYTWSHYLFRQRLKSAAARYPGRHVYETSEPGTSKTCTHCGFWNASLRLGDKLFHCPHCGVQVDRQIAGARNNFLAAYGMAMGVGWDGVGG